MTLRILLVEDSDELRAIIRDWLVSAGCEVVEAGTRAAGAQVALDADAVVVDLSLPDSAPGATATWAAALSGAGLGVVVHTGYPEQAEAATMGRSGVPLVAKGDSREAVVSTILAVATHAAARRALRQARLHTDDLIGHLRALRAVLETGAP